MIWFKQKRFQPVRASFQLFSRLPHYTHTSCPASLHPGTLALPPYIMAPYPTSLHPGTLALPPYTLPYNLPHSSLPVHQASSSNAPASCVTTNSQLGKIYNSVRMETFCLTQFHYRRVSPVSSFLSPHWLGCGDGNTRQRIPSREMSEKPSTSSVESSDAMQTNTSRQLIPPNSAAAL